MQVDWEEQEDDEEYLIDMMWDLEHPPGKTRSDWTGFLGHLGDGVKELTDFKHDMIFAPIYKQANTPKITNQMEPATPDTMMKVEQSLLMPCQEDEMSSIEERQQNAAVRAQNPPLITNTSVLSTTSNRTMTEDGDKKGVDLVGLQRYHNQQV